MVVRKAAPARGWRRVWSLLLAVALVLPGSLIPNNPTAFASSTVWSAAQNRIGNTYNALQGVAYGNGLWVAVGLTSTVGYSSDGVTWSAVDATSVNSTWMTPVYIGNHWVMVGYTGKIYTSPDGATWTPQTSNTTSNLFALATDGTNLVAGGSSGKVVTSSDGGYTWSSAITVGSAQINSVTYGGGQWVLVANSGGIYTSPDGITWTNRISGTNSTLYDVRYANGLYVIVGASGTILTSTDGVTWASHPNGTATTNYLGILFAEGRWLMCGAGGVIFNNNDPVASGWTAETSNTTYNLYRMAYSGNKLVAVGANGTIITRTADSNNANLSGLTLSAGTLSPAFAAGTTSYTASVPYTTSNLNVTATLADTTATLYVNGNPTTSGTMQNVALNVGANTITINVRAQDTRTTKTYTVTVTRAAPSTNNNLSNLTISSGTMTPAFSSSTTTYTATVSNATSSINVTPTVADTFATLTVNGAAAASGSPKSVSLAIGTNTIPVVVTAQDGSTKTYTLTVTRISNIATLSNLTLSSGTLSPSFASGTTSYTASVPNSVTAESVTPTPTDSTATFKVNGTVPTGRSVSVPLNVGNNAINVVVTAQDGTTTKTYTVTVHRLSNNANLSNLTLSSSTLSPAFASGTTSYTASTGASSINVTPTVADSTATVKVNGTTVASGSASPVSLALGANTITVLVTAEDGTTNTYTLTVTRLSTVATLSNLALDAGTLSPAFATGTTSYSASVANSVTSVTVTPTLTDSTASFKVNGTAPTGGSVSVPLNVGNNTVSVVVTAQDGTTTRTYTVTVHRLSNNANLSNLAISAGTLSPAFASGTASYTASTTASSMTVTPTTADSTASVAMTVNGSAMTGGIASLNLGSNTINVVVTAEDGTAKTYTITVTRISTIATLSNLALDSGTLSPAFATGTTSYTASVANSVTSVTVTPTLTDSTATFKVNNTAPTSGSVSVPLNIGTNTVTVVVTAQDGTTTQTYTVTVKRLSNNADLSVLALNYGTLTPAFAPATATYTASVANSITAVAVTPTVADSTATVTVNGSALTGGNATVSLNIGDNLISILVKAEDGTTKTYQVTVTRISNIASLSGLTLSAGALTPAFGSGTTSYTASVANNVTSVTVTPTLTDTTAAFQVNNTAPTGGSVGVPLTVGDNTVSVVVTAQDGTTTQTYTVTVRRLSNDASLSGLALSSGTLTPAFSPATTSYTATTGNVSITVTPTVADSTATVALKVGGATVTNPVALTIGSNPIDVVVTAEDGTTTQTYTITVTRKSNIADLSNLALDAGTLSPSFATGTTSYTVSVANGVSTIAVTPTLADNKASVGVNGTAPTGGAVNVPLNVGDNTVSVVVTAEDGTTSKTYAVTVHRISSNANLSGLVLSSSSLSPAFAAATTSYTATTGSGSVTVTPTLADSTASFTVAVDGTTLPSGNTFTLTLGTTYTVTVDVTAEDGTTQKTYTVTVTRKSNDADLSDLTLNAGTPALSFDPATTSYTVTVADTVTTVTVAPTLHDSHAGFTVNGNSPTSGTVDVTINPGDNPISVVVTAEDGLTTKTYTVTVHRTSNNADLSALVLSSSRLSPTFTPATTSYTATTGSASITVTPAVADGTSTFTVKVDGTTLNDGDPVSLALGASATIDVVVTAEDGTTTKTYTVTVTRKASNADLSDLTLNSGAPALTFDPATTSYSATVANNVSTVTVTPTLADSNASFTVNNTAPTGGAVNVPLSVGDNVVTVLVTAEDTLTTKTYTVTVHRPSNNANLSNLTLSAGTLTPTFAPATAGYSATVANSVTTVTVTPTVADSAAAVTVNGASPATGVALSVGDNLVTVLVTAEDGSSKTYTVTVHRISNDATLSNLTLNSGTLTPAFASATASYTATVANGITTVKVKPVPTDSAAHATVNGAAPDSNGEVSVSLIVGDNPVTVLVTAEDGSTKAYSITVTRLSNKADLSNLTLSSGTLSPAFHAVTTSYSATVANTVTTVIVTPTPVDSKAGITVNGVSPNANGEVSVSMTVGDNTIDVVVTAQDGTSRTYTVVVHRLSNDADLNNLTLNSGTPALAFVPSTTSYSASVANNVSTVTVKPTVADAAAQVTVNGATPDASGSVNVALSVGDNLVTVRVTAEDGTIKTYTVTVRRLSNNADLSTLTLSSGALSPTFAPGTASYSASVPNSVSTVTVTPARADMTATVAVNGTTASGGVAVALSVGDNLVTVLVTAEDGTTKTYTVTVHRLSNDATLSNLTLTSGTLTPAFAPATMGYSASVANNVTTVTVTPTRADSAATVTVNTATASGGVAVPLIVGDNPVTVVVTAEDGTTQTYTITVRRQYNVADLSGLTLSAGTLSPTFDPNAIDYTAATGSAGITVTPTVASSTSTVTVNGTAVPSGSPATVSLAARTTLVTVVVTAQDGTTTKSYSITVTLLSANADLSGLTISAGTLTPTFAPGTTIYASTVGNSIGTLTVTPILADNRASFTVNGTAPTGGAVDVPLNVGDNTITLLVTAEDGSTKPYSIIVRRQSNNADLSSLTVSPGALTPAFASGTASYTVAVPSTASTIAVMPTPADSYAGATVNGTAPGSSGAVSIPLNVGDTTVSVLVTAEDGATQTYTLTVRRASNNADLSNLDFGLGYLSPAFTPGTTSYILYPPYGTASDSLTPTVADIHSTLKLNSSAATSGSPVTLLLNTDASTTVNLQVTAEDGTVKAYAVTVWPAPRFTGAPSNTSQLVSEGAGLTDLQVVMMPGAALSFSLAGGSLPAGINLNSDGTFTGTVTTLGSTSAVIQVTDTHGGMATTTLGVTVQPAPAFTAATANTSQTFSTGNTPTRLDANAAAGDTLSYTVTGGTLSGVTLNPDGTFGGEATTAGPATLVIQAADTHGGKASTTLAVTVLQGPVFTKDSTNTTQAILPGATVAALKATADVGQTVTFHQLSGSLPTGITLNPDGTFTGQVSTLGSSTAVIEVVDGRGGRAKTTLTILVSVPAPPPALSISGGEVTTLTPTISGSATGLDGRTVSVTVDGTGYSGTVVRAAWSVTVTTPLTVGPHAVTATATDDRKQTAKASATITVKVDPVLSQVADQSSNQGDQVTLAVHATGAPGSNLSYAASGLPDGLAIDPATGVISGIPTKDGTYAVTVTVTETAGGGKASKSFTWTVNANRGKLAGTATYDGGGPAAGVSVQLVDAGGKVVSSATTGADGSFGFAAVPAGTYTLRTDKVSTQVTIVAGKTAQVNLAIPTKVTISLSLSPSALVGDGVATGTLTLVATTSDGRPAAGITARLTATAGSLSASTVTTGADGRATATLTAPRLESTAARTESVTASVRDAARGITADAAVAVNFVPASITGVVVDSAGKPVAGAKVSVAEDFDGDGITDFASETTTADDGSYKMYVPRGNWVYKTHVSFPTEIAGKQVTVDAVHESQVGDITGVGQNFSAERTVTGQLFVASSDKQDALPPSLALTHGERISATLRRTDTGTETKVDVSPTGSYSVSNLSPGEYKLAFQVTAPTGEKLAGVAVTVSVNKDGEMSIINALIDPYGTVTDVTTGQPIAGVKMTLMWADTELNRAKGRTPDTPVALPALPDFPPNQNQVPQVTTTAGKYAWMVFPDGDYYILAEKAGYLTYDSRQEGRNVAAAGEDSYVQGGIIHVGQSLVSYDLSMTAASGTHRHYIQGYPDGTFRPDQAISRAEVATVLARLLGLDAPADGRFSDVPASHWAAKAIAGVAARGLMQGDPNGQFRPDAPITRAEVAAIVVRLRKLPLGGAGFTDTSGHWAEGYIAAAKAAGILSGYPDGTFQPGRATTRAEFVTVINRAMGRGPLTGVAEPTFSDVPASYWAFGQVEEAATDHGFTRTPDGVEHLP